MAKPLDISADLTLTVDGEPVPIRGEGDRVVVELPNQRVGRSLIDAALPSTERATRLAQVNATLQEMDVTADVHLRGRRVARLGAQARPGAVSRLLRMDEVEIRPGQTLLAGLSQRVGVGLAALLGVGLLTYWLRRD